jgi:hypothetical protein
VLAGFAPNENAALLGAFPPFGGGVNENAADFFVSSLLGVVAASARAANPPPMSLLSPPGAAPNANLGTPPSLASDGAANSNGCLVVSNELVRDVFGLALALPKMLYFFSADICFSLFQRDRALYKSVQVDTGSVLSTYKQ